MKQVTEIRIDSPIIPNKGIGQIRLGMNSFYLRDIYTENFQNESKAISTDYDKKKWKSSLCKPFFGNLNIDFDDFLEITINLYNGAVSNLKVKNNYIGKVNGIVGLGDSMRTFYNSNIEQYYDFEDGFFYYKIDEEFGLLFYIGDDLVDFPEDEIFEKYLDMPILEIEIFDEKQSIGIGEDLPEKWKL